MESCPEMLVHMSFSSPAQSVTVIYICNQLTKTYKIQLAVVIFAVVFITTLYNIFRDGLRKKSSEICTTFFHLTLVNLNAYIIFILAIVILHWWLLKVCCLYTSSKDRSRLATNSPCLSASITQLFRSHGQA